MATTSTPATGTATAPSLRRTLGLWDLIIIGIVIVQPIAPMGIYGVISNKAGGHVVTTILIAHGGDAVHGDQLWADGARLSKRRVGLHLRQAGKSIPALGYFTGWSMVMDYILNPLDLHRQSAASSRRTFCRGFPTTCSAVVFAAFFTGNEPARHRRLRRGSTM